MRINPVKSSSYDTVKSEFIVDYIRQYAETIYTETDPANREKLAGKSRTELKAIAAELETVTKRLNYILYGRY